MSPPSVSCGRYLISGSGDLPIRHFLRCQLTVHGRRERLLRSLLLRLPERTAMILLPWLRRPTEPWRLRVGERGVTEAIAIFGQREVLEDEGVDVDRTSWILRVGAAEADRGRVIALLFDHGTSWPRAALKLGPRGDAGLEREWRALNDLRRRLLPPLIDTVPRPLARERLEGRDAVLLSAVPGRPADVELQAAWRPRHVVAGHLGAAADWLVAFQRQTRARMPFEAEGWGADLVGGAEEAVAELQRWIAPRPPALTAAHGDLWARNLLVASGREMAAVVDWEGYRPTAAPFEDPLHFAVAYARRYHRGGSAGSAEAFRAAFVTDTTIARHLAGFLHRWSKGLGIDPRCLRPALRLFVERRATGVAGPHRHTDEERRFWRQSKRILEASTRSALSG